MILEDVFEDKGIVGEDSFVSQELAEGHAVEGVCSLATREVDLSIVHDEER